VVVADKRNGPRLAWVRVWRRYAEHNLRAAMNDSFRRPVAEPRSQHRTEVKPEEAQGAILGRRILRRGNAFFAGQAYTNEGGELIDRISGRNR
jgi:hypothetical protein